ncbi:hypothetical protein J6590_039509 [Homalodisca vitripennis]|nr:hypothetical protein J6590_039509 [Homalodisca vitripennis]
MYFYWPRLPSRSVRSTSREHECTTPPTPKPVFNCSPRDHPRHLAIVNCPRLSPETRAFPVTLLLAGTDELVVSGRSAKKRFDYDGLVEVVLYKRRGKAGGRHKDLHRPLPTLAVTRPVTQYTVVLYKRRGKAGGRHTDLHRPLPTLAVTRPVTQYTVVLYKRRGKAGGRHKDLHRPLPTLAVTRPSSVTDGLQLSVQQVVLYKRRGKVGGRHTDLHRPLPTLAVTRPGHNSLLPHTITPTTEANEGRNINSQIKYFDRTSLASTRGIRVSNSVTFCNNCACSAAVDKATKSYSRAAVVRTNCLRPTKRKGSQVDWNKSKKKKDVGQEFGVRRRRAGVSGYADRVTGALESRKTLKPHAKRDYELLHFLPNWRSRRSPPLLASHPSSTITTIQESTLICNMI